MAILVDYRCSGCGVRAEHWVPSPPVANVPCRDCGAESRREWAPVGLSSPTPTPQPSATAPAPLGRSVCSQYPQVPGLCHMSESAGRMWVAKYLKDGRAIDREQERQERRAAVLTPTMADAITHQHHDAAATSPVGASAGASPD